MKFGLLLFSLLIVVLQTAHHAYAKDENSKRVVKFDKQRARNRRRSTKVRGGKRRYEKKRNRSRYEGPFSFKEERNSVVELENRNQTRSLQLEAQGLNLLFIYSNYNDKNQKLCSVFNELSLIENDAISKVKFYRVNSQKARGIMKINSIFELPAVLFFVNDEKMTYLYEGDLTSEMLLKFVQYHTNTHITEISSPLELAAHKKKGSNLLIVGDYNKYKEDFVQIAKHSKKNFKNVLWSKHEEFFRMYNISKDEYDAVAYFTINNQLTKGEKFSIFSSRPLSSQSIAKLAEVYSRSSFSFISQYTLETAIKNKLKLVLYIFKEESKSLDYDLSSLAIEYRRDYWFLKSNNLRHIAETIIDSLCLPNKKNENYPIIAIIDNVQTNTRDLDFYVMDKKITKNKENVKEFIEAHKSKKLIRTIYSENPLPTKLRREQIENIQHFATFNNITEFNFTSKYNIFFKSVALTFHKDLFENPGFDVLLYVNSDSDICVKFYKVLNRVAAKMVKNTKFRWFDFNYIYNEIPKSFKINRIPTLIMVPDTSKNTNKTFFIFKGNFTTENVVEFIKSHSTFTLDQVHTLPNESKIYESERNNVNYFPVSIQQDELNLNLHANGPLGAGFKRAVKRFTKEYEEDKENFRDEVSNIEEEYDFEDEVTFYKEHTSIKTDL